MFFNVGKIGKNAFYLYLVGIVLVLIGYTIGQMPLFFQARYNYANIDSVTAEKWEAFTENSDLSAVAIGNNYGLFLLILMFIVAILVLMATIRYLHQKPLLSVFTSRPALDWNRVFFGFGLWIILGIFAESISYIISPNDYSFHFAGKDFFILLTISVLLLPIQTTFEELFFRGYLMQGIGITFNSRIAGILVSSLLFALMHITNPEIGKYGIWTMELYYFLAGLFLALVAYWDNGLELSLGIHAATNVFGSVFLTYEGSILKTDALVTFKNVDVYTMIFSFLCTAAIFTYIIFRKYHLVNDPKMLQAPIVGTSEELDQV